MGKVDSGGILHQQHHVLSRGLFSGLLQVRLHQRRKGHIWLIQPTIQGFGFFPGVHLSRQRTQRILRQVGGRLNRASGATQIMQVDLPKGSLGPALRVQHILRSHPSILSLWNMWGRIRALAMGSRHVHNHWVECITSSYYGQLHGHSEREIMLASAELREQNRDRAQRGEVGVL